ncbi:phytoene desaturase family protein [Streptomyces aidingensis]|uniref:Phytoene dehydrogenase-related protein n=1 Tax=Streptomyces aidingensis TaxID=910347 RepID=A0A1I1LSB0_9ACTN|nr:NAD(P)/FAD-dependent oxidoreductase [Streptomyces aidingensis]SFC73173.1 Phytoene dehydrogenase-related protein [Streptomyces aidingensis]
MARIAVVGAGMGALAAAARLATAGHRVTVYERTGTHGGALRRYRRDGFAFDTGPGLLHLPAVWRDLFLKTGRQPLEECVPLHRVDPAAEHRFADGTVVRLPGLSRGGVRQALDAALGPGTGDRWAALLDRARESWERTRRPLLEEPLTPDPGRRAAAAAGHWPPARRSLRPAAWRRRRPPSLAAVARDELRDPRLAALLGSVVSAYGVDPGTAPAHAAVLAYVEETFGSWYPEGGMRALADAVHRRCLDRGVRFVFGAEATGVLERDGRASGVQLADGRREPADHVVWGAPGLGAPARGTGRCTLLLALRGPRPADTAHRTVLHSGNPDPDPDGGPRAPRTVTVLRPDDPALRPDDGHEAVVLSAPVPAPGPGPGPGPGPEDWAAFGERMLDAAEAAGLRLRARIRWRELRTPADVARETGMPGGLVPPPALAGGGGAWLAAPNTGRLPGAYRVGGLAHPGGGLAHAGMSGAMAAGLITEGPHWRGSS